MTDAEDQLELAAAIRREVGDDARVAGAGASGPELDAGRQDDSDSDTDSDSDSEALYRRYAALAAERGSATTDEDVHEAWSAWAREHDPAHASLRPFAELSAAEQAKDRPFRDAIRRVAARRRS